MNPQLMLFAIVAFVCGIFYIASTSIGVNCYNENPSYKDKQSTNLYFLLANLGCAILLILIGSSLIAVAAKS